MVKRSQISEGEMPCPRRASSLSITLTRFPNSEFIRWRYVRWIIHVWQGAEIRHHSCAHGGFAHAAQPAAYAVFAAELVYGEGRRNAADACILDVDVLAGADFNGLARVLHGADAFIQADGRCDLPLQFCMVKQVVMHQRLLYHRKIVFVQ